MKKKIAVIGAGFVGTMVAQRVVERSLADVILADVVDGIPQGKALDIAQSSAIEGFDAVIRGTCDFSEIEGSSIVVITAGFPRTPGMTREDLARKNAGVITSVMDNIRRFAPSSIVIVVTNPLDVMAHLSWIRSGFPPERVFGMGGVLDEARFRYFLSLELKVSPRDIEALVLGSHGEAMLPLESHTTMKGIPVRNILSKERFAEIVERTRQGGAEIVELLKTGSAWHAPSAAVVAMIEAALHDSKRMMSASAYLDGQYGISDIHIGVPVVVGSGGIERVCELPLNKNEMEALRRAADIAREMVARLE